jgi:hypothetical protein
MSQIYRDNAIIPLTPAADYTTKKGYLVDVAGGTATISSSATTPAKGVIVEGNDTAAGYAAEKVSVAVLGAVKGTVPMRCGGTIAAGALVCQHSDGTVITDAGSGARVAVGIALEGGSAGENIEVAPITPRIYAS